MLGLANMSRIWYLGSRVNQPLLLHVRSKVCTSTSLMVLLLLYHETL